MASSLPSAKSPNQTQLAKYQELINQGKAKKIATVTQDGRIVDRYILVKYTDGDWVPGNELDGISDTKLQEINDAAQANIAAQGRAHNSEGKQASFADKHDFHIVKLEDESLDDKDVSHKETLLGGIDHTSYHGASGGKTSDGITKNQKDILDFGKKRPADRTETREELKKLSDKTFVKFYQEAYKASPSSTHQELFKTALEKYVTKTVESYQFSLHGDDLATEMKELSKAAHLAFNPSEASPKEDWLETDAASHVGEADYATAIFKAIIVRGEDHGKFTAGHAFTTLITKVNEAWYEMKRENQIDADSVVVIDIPRDSSGVGSSHSTHRSHSSPSVTHPIPTVVTTPGKVIFESLNSAENEADKRNLDKVTKQLAKIESLSETINTYDHHHSLYEPDTEKEELQELLLTINEDHGIPRTVTPDKEAIVQQLQAEKDYFTQKIEFRKNPQALLADRGRLETRARALPEEIRTASDSYLSGHLSGKPPKQLLMKKQREVHAKLAVLDDWASAKGRLGLLAPIMLKDVGDPPVTAADYLSAFNKIVSAAPPTAFSDAEIKAISNWKVAEAITTGTDQQQLVNLLSFLRTEAGSELNATEVLKSRKLESIGDINYALRSNHEAITEIKDLQKVINDNTGTTRLTHNAEVVNKANRQLESYLKEVAEELELATGTPVPGFDKDSPKPDPVLKALEERIGILSMQKLYLEDFDTFCDEKNRLEGRKRDLPGEIAGATNSIRSGYLSGTSPKQQLEKEQAQVHRSLDLMDKMLEQTSARDKLDLVTELALQRKTDPAITGSDYASAYRMLTADPLDVTSFTDNELKAISTWEAPKKYGATNTELYDSLTTFLRKKGAEVLCAEASIPKVETQVALVNTGTAPYNTFAGNATAANYQAAHELLLTGDPDISTLHEDDPRVLALRQAAEETGVFNPLNAHVDDTPLEKSNLLAAKLNEYKLAKKQAEFDTQFGTLFTGGEAFDSLNTTGGYTSWAPQAAHFELARDWLKGTKTADQLTKEAVYAIRLLGNALPATQTELEEASSKLQNITYFHMAMDETRGISDSASSPYDTWLKTGHKAEDIRGALDWLENPTARALENGEKFALKYVRPRALDQAPLQQLAEMKAALQRQERVLSIPTISADLTGYNSFAKQDLIDAHAWLDGTVDKLTDGAKKALRKINTENAPRDNALDKKGDHFTTQTTAGYLVLNQLAPHTDIWDRAEQRLTTAIVDEHAEARAFSALPLDQKKALYNTILDKLTNDQHLDNDLQRYALKFRVGLVKAYEGSNQTIQANALHFILSSLAAKGCVI